MPRLIAASDEEAIELGDVIEALETERFDPADEDCFASFGPILRKLANNRRFLADFVVEELKGRCGGQVRRNQYGAQVILLHGLSARYLIRANVWPSLSDSALQTTAPESFFYDVPHDHNFSFLTVGYAGPGYWSDYYEYDYPAVAGHAGERVDLRFVERARLSEGKVLLYRAHRDVHLQLPPDTMSVSLNILGLAHGSEFLDQYRFDVERREIDAVITRSTLEPMLALAAQQGGGNGRDLVESFAAAHPSERIRFAALRALASAADGVDGRLSVYERAASSPSRFVSRMGLRELDRLRTTRAWIERAPA